MRPEFMNFMNEVYAEWEGIDDFAEGRKREVVQKKLREHFGEKMGREAWNLFLKALEFRRCKNGDSG